MIAISRKTILIGLCLAAVAGAGYWWTGRYGDDDARHGAGRGKRFGQEIPVRVAVARTQDVPVTIDAIGTVQALNTATIRTQVDGRLVALQVTEGEDVRKGEIVAEIEPNLYQAAYDQAVAKKAQDEANLANARIDLVRYEKLAATNYGSQQQFMTQKYLVAQLEALVKTDQALIDSAKTTLGYCKIPSPIDGRVGIRGVDVGNILHASDLTGILTITQLKPIYVIFVIPQEKLLSVQNAVARGSKKVSALGPDNQTEIDPGKQGEVTAIDNQIDQSTGTAKIKATFANQSLKLWPGEFVNVRMVVDTLKNAVVVPATAIRPGPSGPYVYLLTEGDVAITRNVKVSQQDENIAVVASGLQPGDTVLTSGFGRLSDGAKVRVVSDEPPVGEGADDKQAREDASANAGALTPPRGEHRRNREGRGGGNWPARGDRALQGGEARPGGAQDASAPPAKADESPKRSDPAQGAGPPRQ
ncbi:MAG TPA: efflux RND transporter periplasmic adaptor subunit, partial [Roseiarcus sp.]|nr:efflux RND transporter periplasmic adaptor subunit [Roseiarcus sp.]